MRTIIVVLGSAVALVAVAAFGRIPQRAEPAAAAAPGASDELQAELQLLRTQTAALSAEVAALRRQPLQLQALATAVASKGDQPAAMPAAMPDARSEEEIEAERARDEQRHREVLDAALSREQPDRSWTEATTLPDRLREALPEGSTIVSSDCGSSLCRVITSHRDLAAYQLFHQQAFMRPDPENPTLWHGAGAFMRLDPPASDPTSVRVSAYLSRSETLPSVPAPAPQ